MSSYSHKAKRLLIAGAAIAACSGLALADSSGGGQNGQNGQSGQHGQSGRSGQSNGSGGSRDMRHGRRGAMRRSMHGRRGGPRPPRATAMKGTITGFNYTPRGDYQSVLLRHHGQTVQLDLPPGASSMLARHLRVGQTLHAKVTPMPHMPPHPVYQLVSFQGRHGKVHHFGPRRGKLISESGKIDHLNYTPNGNVDGAVLKNGDFIHIGRMGSGLYKLHLKAGETLRVKGRAHRMPVGDHQVVEARSVNGVKIPRPRPQRGAFMPPWMHPGGRFGPGGPGGPPGGPRGPGGPGGPPPWARHMRRGQGSGGNGGPNGPPPAGQ